MKTCLAKRIGCATVTGAALLLSSFGATAASQRAIDVLTARGAAEAGSLPKQAKAQSGVSGVLNPSALNASSLTLTLADGTTIEARLQRTASDSGKGTQSWIGTFDDAPGSVLVLSKAKGVVTGFANYKDQIIEIQPSSGGKHVIYAVDESRTPKGELLLRPKMAADTTGTTSTGYGVGTTTATTTNIVQDVLVLYTAATAARYGQASIESQIQSAVQAANQAYQNSLVGITLNIVGVQQSTVGEGSSMSAALSALQANSAAASLRNQVAADMVMLVSENTDYCGLSNLMTSNSTSFAPSAYSVVASDCLSNQSLAHEFGHQQGLMHDRDSSSGWSGVYPYSYGYRRCVSDGTGFRDVMSYSCTGAPRVLEFSNPNVTWNGYPAGVSYELDPANSAENARSLNNTASTVAAFRGAVSTSTPPAAPSGMTVQASAYNSVSLAWTDNATNETGFKLERSPNGVDFAEIATLGADARAYTDGSVAAKTAYYYRVRAYNSAGVSAYSGTVSVTTPDVPPPPPSAPSSVAALDDKDGTATVAWTASTTNVSSFEVRREKWDTRKLVWGSATTAATVPVSSLSIIDSTGAGQYRYSVRAVNSGGASGYAGPAPVTVTSATSTTSPSRGKKR